MSTLKSNVDYPELTDRDLFREVVQVEVDTFLQLQETAPSGWSGRFRNWRSVHRLHGCLAHHSWNLAKVVRCIRESGNVEAIASMQKLFADEEENSLEITDLEDTLESYLGDALRAAIKEQLILEGIDPRLLNQFANWFADNNCSDEETRDMFRRYVKEGECVPGIADYDGEQLSSTLQMGGESSNS